ncbi:MAG: zinc ribbon domain-containing protein [Deltaproteobacteria bacterium]|nr:zinc ribbon domain-containing protein [Deltaproteobacteria bacterium]
MPIYEYHCRQCGHEFEMLRQASEKDSSVKCPHCGRKKAKKMMSLFGGGGVRTGGACSSCSTPSCNT